ncbi:hypothetical protein BD626DRAFT_490835 [Schizophyllum amplum]|uniref:Chitin-binding type-4 domain-containing protein n=1 Tax=Schizophyllum amplum TaxID=97359 RepID=A0A550CJW9_9AGAR|nr:hypothetical protein BD626DRAFT_490835 [Auriculariopsis ampla]
MRAFVFAIRAFATLQSSVVVAHMMMTDPPPLRSQYNEYSTNADYDMTSPLASDGSNYPCKGYLDDTDGKEAVATWKAGSSQSVTLEGSATHGGGSCQLSISEDDGASFKVIKSFEGGCPTEGPDTLNVDVPSDVSSGTRVLAWTWNNQIGNREYYMNCAMITIEDGGSGLDSYPDVFVAQLSSINSCTVAEGVDVLYPSPGDQVEREDGDSNLGDPTGDCGPVSSSSGSSSSGGSSSGSSSSSSDGSSTASGESSAGEPSTTSQITSSATVTDPTSSATMIHYSTLDTDTSYSAGAGASPTSGIGSYPSSSAGTNSSSSAGTDTSAYGKCRLVGQHQPASLWRRRLSSVVRSFGLYSAV